MGDMYVSNTHIPTNVYIYLRIQECGYLIFNAFYLQFQIFVCIVGYVVCTLDTLYVRYTVRVLDGILMRRSL